MRELTPKRLEYAQTEAAASQGCEAVRYKKLIGPLFDPAPYLALVLDILGSCAVRMRPDLRDKFDEIEEFILEEYTVERLSELKSVATTVH